MSELKRPDAEIEEDSGPHSKGTNLVLIYSLVLLALLAAVGVALMIVFPFYHRR